MHPHAPASVQVKPPSQPPQAIVLLQLSMLGPHRPLHHVSAGTGEQHVLPRQMPPSAQLQLREWPHVSVTPASPH
jgi:hypothetical protein